MAVDPGERYTIEELITLYEYEPSLRDVYVEGRSDVGFLTWYFKQLALSGVVYAIDDRVNVPGDIARGLDQDVNARGRLIALAITFERSLGVEQKAATVVVDADVAWLTGPHPIHRSCLLMTDWPAIERYAFAEKPLAKLLHVGLHLPAAITASAVIEAIGPALSDLFAARAVLFQFGIRCIDDVARVCTLVAGRSSADMRELISRSLAQTPAADRPASIEDLTEWSNDVKSWIEGPTWIGRGHDIAPLLIKYLGLKGPLANRESLEVVMRMSLDLDDLEDAPLFQALRDRIAS